jgi:hypothetical protein
LKGTVAVNTYSLFSKFREGQFRVKQSIGYRCDHIFLRLKSCEFLGKLGKDVVVAAEEIGEDIGRVIAYLSE